MVKLVRELESQLDAKTVGLLEELFLFVSRLSPLINVDLSQIIWVKWLHMSLPKNPIVREIFGLTLVAAYFLALPPLLAKRSLKMYYEKLGPARFHIMVFLGLTMLSLPIKMMLRWTLNMHYVVTVPEIFFNI